MLNQPEYRFEFKIVDSIKGVEILAGSTYVLPDSIGDYGECESVDIEVASVMRHFKRKGREEHESECYEEDNIEL